MREICADEAEFKRKAVAKQKALDLAAATTEAARLAKNAAKHSKLSASPSASLHSIGQHQADEAHRKNSVPNRRCSKSCMTQS